MSSRVGISGRGDLVGGALVRPLSYQLPRARGDAGRARRPRRPHHHLPLGSALRPRDQGALALDLTRVLAPAHMAGRRDLCEGARQLDPSLPRGRRGGAHARLPPVAHPLGPGHQTIPRQGDPRVQGVGDAGHAYRRQDAHLSRRHCRAEAGGPVPAGSGAPPGQVPQQRDRGRPSSAASARSLAEGARVRSCAKGTAQKADQADTRVQVDADRLCHHQGLRGDARSRRARAARTRCRTGSGAKCASSNAPSASAPTRYPRCSRISEPSIRQPEPVARGWFTTSASSAASSASPGRPSTGTSDLPVSSARMAKSRCSGRADDYGPPRHMLAGIPVRSCPPEPTG